MLKRFSADVYFLTTHVTNVSGLKAAKIFFANFLGLLKELKIALFSTFIRAWMKAFSLGYFWASFVKLQSCNVKRLTAKMSFSHLGKIFSRGRSKRMTEKKLSSGQHRAQTSKKSALKKSGKKKDLVILPVKNLFAALGCFMVVTFLIFSQGDWLFDKFMGVEIHD